jgi:hypothetical protein
MKNKIILLLFLLYFASCVPSENHDQFNIVFSTESGFHGPVKTITTKINDFMHEYNRIGLTTQCLPNGRIKSTQFYDLDGRNFVLVTVRFCYDNKSKLTGIEYYDDKDNLLITSNIIESSRKNYLSQQILKGILGYIVDYDGRFFF